MRPRPSRLLNIARVIFILNAVIWLVFGVWSLLRISGPGLAQWAVALLMFVNAAAMLWSSTALGRQQKRPYFLALLILLSNILLTLTDQMGLFDWATLAVDLLLLGLMAVIGKRLLSAPAAGTHSEGSG